MVTSVIVGPVGDKSQCGKGGKSVSLSTVLWALLIDSISLMKVSIAIEKILVKDVTTH